VQGDIHDIGKNIVKLLMENYGYDVVDLGRDVAPEAVVEAVLAHKAPLVGLSALMTTTVPAMETTIQLLREKCPACKIVVGGAVLTAEYAAKIGADKYAAVQTLKAVDLITKELGCHTSLGVSNVSFGLPARDIINGAFFTQALARGLSAAIMNPFSVPMMRTYYSYKALSDMDDNCAEYIAFAESHKTEEIAGAKSESKALSGKTALSDAIIKGLSDSAKNLTKELLKEKAPLFICD
jgi:cobalamin-dependent methionine synthase I